jgi:hypothetical protein
MPRRSGAKTQAEGLDTCIHQTRGIKRLLAHLLLLVRDKAVMSTPLQSVDRLFHNGCG